MPQPIRKAFKTCAPQLAFLAIAICALVPALPRGLSAQTAAPRGSYGQLPDTGKRTTVSSAEQILRDHGKFLTHPVWGSVWQPNTSPAWRPYTNGHWTQITGGKWQWNSSEPFGDTVYHYGRWTFDDDYRWIWVPGSMRAPSWVAWRDGTNYVGWAPLPPTPRTENANPQNRSDIYDDPQLARHWVYVPRDKLSANTLQVHILPENRNPEIRGLTQPATLPGQIIARAAPRDQDNVDRDSRNDGERDRYGDGDDYAYREEGGDRDNYTERDYDDDNGNYDRREDGDYGRHDNGNATGPPAIIDEDAYHPAPPWAACPLPHATPGRYVTLRQRLHRRRMERWRRYKKHRSAARRKWRRARRARRRASY